MGKVIFVKGNGSPAHAGIDLPLRVRRMDHRRFPRTRGDRPIGGLMVAWTIEVPPHTRG